MSEPGGAEIRRGSRRRYELPLWSLAGLAAAVWLIRYAARFGLRLASPPQWAHHFDQERYIASANALAHGVLSPSSHWYPLGYALIGAPFSRIIPNEPFFLPDLALFVVTALTFVMVMRRLGVGATASMMLFLLGDMVIGKIARLWIVPWTTSLSAPLVWGLIAQTLAIIDRPADGARPGRGAWLGLGLLAGALPLVRPTDGLMALIAVAFAVTISWRQRRLSAAGLGWLLLGGLALCLPYALLHLAIYGPRISDYARDAAHQGFAFADLPWKTYVIVFTAAPWFPDSPSLVEIMPWSLPGAAGLGLAWLYGGHRARMAVTLVALLAIPYCALFLAYTDLQPPGLWTFSNAHYFKWLFPLLAAGCWLWLRALRSRQGARRAAIALAVLIVPAAIRPVPVAVPDTVPARMLLFRGAANRSWDEAYFAPATITDARGAMINVGRFHQVPDMHGERALAGWRLFQGPAERADPGEAPPYRTAERPYARYAVRLSPGLPCWVRRQALCRIPPP